MKPRDKLIKSCPGSDVRSFLQLVQLSYVDKKESRSHLLRDCISEDGHYKANDRNNCPNIRKSSQSLLYFWGWCVVSSDGVKILQ